jgi:HSP20 family protein
MAYLNRYDPFREALSLRDAMDRLFQESFVRPSAATGRAGWVPMDVEETGDAYRMNVQLPGWKPEDVNVTVQESTVTISGQYSSAPERKDEESRTWHVRERSFASFNRTFSLPIAIDANRAKASFENGELVLTLPKAESAKPRQITIGGAAAPARPAVAGTAEPVAAR